jgi:hypothetical protein
MIPLAWVKRVTAAKLDTSTTHCHSSNYSSYSYSTQLQVIIWTNHLFLFSILIEISTFIITIILHFIANQALLQISPSYDVQSVGNPIDLVFIMVIKQKCFRTNCFVYQLGQRSIDHFHFLHSLHHLQVSYYSIWWWVLCYWCLSFIHYYYLIFIKIRMHWLEISSIFGHWTFDIYALCL